MSWEIEVSDSVQERVERDGYESLSRAERMYDALSWFLFAAYDPGLDQYLAETPADRVGTALDALSEIGASQMFDALTAALRVLPEQEATLEQRRAYIAALSDEGYEAFLKADRMLAAAPYPQDLLVDFVRRLDDEFRGPRTHVELWESRVARGVDTTPKYVTKQMDFEKEAEIDRRYSSRGCPKCKYPTPDYRPRCKRCDYPHGCA
jgi:hypothetical protein